MQFKGHINAEGKPLTYGRAEMDAWFWKNRGKKFKIELKEDRSKRSNSQNAWYWSAIVPTVRNAINECGNEFTLEETHEFLKAQFNFKEVEVSEGHFIKVPVSTTELDKTDFTVYADKIIQFAAEMFGVRIPLPEEQLTLITLHDAQHPNTAIVDAA